MAFELQADCYAGTWAKSAYEENRLEDGDVQEALDAALAVGDFDASNPGHHGTPEQREEAWNSGFEAGDPPRATPTSSRPAWVMAAPSSAGQQQVPAPEQTDPTYPQDQQTDPTYPQDQRPTRRRSFRPISRDGSGRP